MGSAHHAGMKFKTKDRIGVLIVRLWMEPHHKTGLRARITKTHDTSSADLSVAAGASAEDICTVVKEWVDGFADPTSSISNSYVTTVRDDD